MKTIYLDDRNHTITISDEGYKQIIQIINTHRVCRTCKQPYTDERPMVSENMCLSCLLRKEENRLLTFVGVLSVDSYGTNYGFLDPQGYIHDSSTTSQKVERNEYQTLVHWGFPVMASYTDGDKTIELDFWRWSIHGNVKHNSVLVLEHTEYSSGTRRAFLSYKGGGCVFFITHPSGGRFCYENKRCYVPGSSQPPALVIERIVFCRKYP